MSFNISRFKSTFDKYGGPARPSLFEVNVYKYKETNSNIDPIADFSFFCKSANFPGVELETQQMTAVAQRPKTFPVGVNNPPFSAIFLVDSDHEILTFFHNWIQRVVNYSSRGGSFGAIDGDPNGNGMLPQEIGFKDEYSCRLTIKHYSTESASNGRYYEVVLDKCYPFNVGELDLAWEQNDSFLTLPVSFAYDEIYFSGDRSGAPSGRGRGGILEALGDLAGFAGVVQQTLGSGKPTSIQDAVNRLNRVRNSFGNLSASFPERNTGDVKSKLKPTT